VGVACQIFEHGLWSTEGRFAVDDPVGAVEDIDKRAEGFPLGQRRNRARKDQLGGLERLSETVKKLAPKETRENSNREEESSPYGDPAIAGEVYAPSGHDHVQMRVIDQSLTPRMEDGHEPDPRTEMVWVSTDFE